MREYALDLNSYLIGPRRLGCDILDMMLILCAFNRTDYLTGGSDFIKLIQVSKNNCRKWISDYLEMTHCRTI
jgi:hypothetical protein